MIPALSNEIAISNVFFIGTTLSALDANKKHGAVSYSTCFAMIGASSAISSPTSLSTAYPSIAAAGLCFAIVAAAPAR